MRDNSLGDGPYYLLHVIDTENQIHGVGILIHEHTCDVIA